MIPFSRTEFFGVFAGYNTSVWPAQLALYGLAVAMVAEGAPGQEPRTLDPLRAGLPLGVDGRRLPLVEVHRHQRTRVDLRGPLLARGRSLRARGDEGWSAEVRSAPGLAARWVTRRFSLEAHGPMAKAGIGILGLVLLVGTEIGFVLQLRGISLGDYVAQRDPVSGTVYALSLLLFAAMPSLINEKTRSREP